MKRHETLINVGGIVIADFGEVLFHGFNGICVLVSADLRIAFDSFLHTLFGLDSV